MQSKAVFATAVKSGLSELRTLAMSTIEIDADPEKLTA